VNLLGDNIDTVKKNTQTLTDASKEVGLEVNAERTNCKYMLLSRHQNAGQTNDMKIANRCFENVAQFRYLETLNSGSACYHSAQNLLSSRLLPKNKN
jgi:hypothetical protein